MIRKFAVAIIIMSVLVMIGSVVMASLTDYAPVTDEVAIGQLNGGDEAFAVLQTYNTTKHIAQSLTTGLGLATIILCVVVLYKIYKDHK